MTESIHPHSEEAEEAHATQFYIAELQFPDHAALTTGDAENYLLLTDNDYDVGEEIVSESKDYRRVLKIIEGPIDCPPLPHVQDLENWVHETNHPAAEHLPMHETTVTEKSGPELEEEEVRCGRCGEVNGVDGFRFDDREHSMYAVPRCPTCNEEITDRLSEAV